MAENSVAHSLTILERASSILGLGLPIIQRSSGATEPLLHCELLFNSESDVSVI